MKILKILKQKHDAPQTYTINEISKLIIKIDYEFYYQLPPPTPKPKKNYEKNNHFVYIIYQRFRPDLSNNILESFTVCKVIC